MDGEGALGFIELLVSVVHEAEHDEFVRGAGELAAECVAILEHVEGPGHLLVGLQYPEVGLRFKPRIAFDRPILLSPNFDLRHDEFEEPKGFFAVLVGLRGRRLGPRIGPLQQADSEQQFAQTRLAPGRI